MDKQVQTSKQRIKELVGDVNFTKIENLLDGLVDMGIKIGEQMKYASVDTSFQKLYKDGVTLKTMITRFGYSRNSINTLVREAVKKGAKPRKRVEFVKLPMEKKCQLVGNNPFEDLIDDYIIDIKYYTTFKYKMGKQ